MMSSLLNPFLILLEGDTVNTIYECDEILRQDKDVTPTLFMIRALAHASREEHENAERDFTRYIEKNGGDLLSYEFRAECYEQIKHYSSALSDIDSAIECYDNNDYDEETLVRLQKRRDIVEQFIQASDKLVEIGMDFLQKQVYNAANEKFSEALKINRENSDAFEMKGQVALIDGDHGGALDHFQNALTYCGDNKLKRTRLNLSVAFTMFLTEDSESALRVVKDDLEPNISTLSDAEKEELQPKIDILKVYHPSLSDVNLSDTEESEKVMEQRRERHISSTVAKQPKQKRRAASRSIRKQNLVTPAWRYSPVCALTLQVGT